jgi:hypothetical protein
VGHRGNHDLVAYPPGRIDRWHEWLTGDGRRWRRSRRAIFWFEVLLVIVPLLLLFLAALLFIIGTSGDPWGLGLVTA